MAKGKTVAWGALVLGLGLVGLLIGVLSDLYTTNVGVIMMLAVWLIGGAIVGLTMGGNNEETPKPPEQPQPGSPQA
ncbi:MAG: hypothetical protein V1838_03640 [Patescibacteria group bacterium]